MSNLTQDMSWSVRLALQSQFGLTNKQAAASFNVSVDEVATAQDLAKAGTITIATDVDYSQYEGEFEVSAKDTSSSSTSTSKPEVKAPTPVTATKLVCKPFQSDPRSSHGWPRYEKPDPSGPGVL